LVVREPDPAGGPQEALGTACGLHRTEVSLLERPAASHGCEPSSSFARALELRPTVLLDHID